MSASGKAVKTGLSTYPEHAQIREAAGISVDEKLLLYVIASHQSGVCFGSVATIRAWTGLSRNRYYAARKGLLAAGLVTAEVSRGGATTYRVRKRALQAAAQSGVDVRKQRRPVPVPGTAAPGIGDKGDTRSSDVTCADVGHSKENLEENEEEIKNMNASKKVRPPRPSQAGRNGVVLRTTDEKKAATREMIDKYKRRYSQ